LPEEKMQIHYDQEGLNPELLGGISQAIKRWSAAENISSTKKM
jgi:hypothetical protein